MYYLLAFLLFILTYFICMKVLKSIIKGIFLSLSIVLFVIAATIFIKSSKTPVNVLNLYEVDKFEVRKL